MEPCTIAYEMIPSSVFPIGRSLGQDFDVDVANIFDHIQFNRIINVYFTKATYCVYSMCLDALSAVYRSFFSTN